MKKFLSLLLALTMLLSLTACSNNGNNETTTGSTEGTSAPSVDNNGIAPDTYTYNTYTTALGTNWNPHTWENSADSSIMSYIEAPLTDITVDSSEDGTYQWIFVAATDIKDVTADHQDDLEKYNVTLPEGKTAADITDSYVYEISLREGMCWQDGTVINADTYIYSMQQLLDPDMKNYRANNYYSGESALAGAYEYYYSKDEGVNISVYGTYETIDEAMAAGDTVYVDMWNFWGLAGCVDADGNECPQWVAIDDTTLYRDAAVAEGEEGDWISGADIYAMYGPYFANGVGYEDYISLYRANEAFGFTWDGVGLYKVDDYTIRYVCDVAYDYYYFLTSCTSNWIVHEELYESCKEFNEDGSFKGSTYGTSLETTMSYGPYKITSLEDGKQLVYEQNEKYWEYTTDDNGNLYSTTYFLVDGEYQPQYLTQKVIVNVMQNDAAKLAFLAGELDDWSVEADDVITYSTSEQLYKVDETYTMRLFFHTNLDTLKTLDAEGANTNSVVLSNTNFRKAMSLAIDRTEFVTATAAYKPAYSIISSLYYYNVYEDPESVYRNTDAAMQAICNVYGVEYGDGTPYATLEDAYKSINGYNLSEATALFTQACQELVEAGLYTEGQDIKIQIAYSAGAMSAAANQQVTLLNKYLNTAMEGTGFGTITLEAVDNLTNRYADVANGVYAIGYGAWGGAAFYPFTLFQVYCDPDYVNPIHEKGCWDPATETLTLNVNGEDVTMTWQEWSSTMGGTGKFANADLDTKLQILADLEENLIEKYYFIPMCTTTSCSMLSYKTNNYTDNYSIMYGFGGIRLMTYNYTNAEWAEYVASVGGEIGY